MTFTHHVLVYVSHTWFQATHASIWPITPDGPYALTWHNLSLFNIFLFNINNIKVLQQNRETPRKIVFFFFHLGPTLFSILFFSCTPHCLTPGPTDVSFRAHPLLLNKKRKKKKISLSNSQFTTTTTILFYKYFSNPTCQLPFGPTLYTILTPPVPRTTTCSSRGTSSPIYLPSTRLPPGPFYCLKKNHSPFLPRKVRKKP